MKIAKIIGFTCFTLSIISALAGIWSNSYESVKFGNTGLVLFCVSMVFLLPSMLHFIGGDIKQ